MVHDKALTRVMTGVLKDDTELFKQSSDNETFKRWLPDTVFDATYETATPGTRHAIESEIETTKAPRAAPEGLW